VSVLFDLRLFCYLVRCERCGWKTNSCSNCPGVLWLERVISLSSCNCSCNIKSFCNFLPVVNLFYLDIKGCNIMCVAPVIIE
jgi:hypothetical protein